MRVYIGNAHQSLRANDNYNLETSHVLPAIIRKIHLAHCLETGDWISIRKDLTKRPIEGANGNSTDVDILSLLKKYGIEYTDSVTPGISTEPQHLKQVRVLLWGTGKVFREFLHVDDMASGCLLVMQKLSMVSTSTGTSASTSPPNYYLNLGSGKDQTIEELSEVVKKIIGFNGQIHFDKIHSDGTHKKLLDCSRIQALGFQPKYTLEQGIRMVYNSYVKEG